MIRATSKMTGRFLAIAIALVLASVAVLAAVPATQAHADEGATQLAAAPLSTQASDTSYSIALKGAPFDGAYGIYAKPGEKLTMRANVQYRDPDTWETVTVKGATFKWTKVSAKLKATTKGNKLVVKKFPKDGKYQFTVTAYNAKGKKLVSQKYKIIVKSKPVVKIKASTLSNGDSLYLMNGASFGWDNNTKKPFYVWAFKNLSTGHTSVWNSNKGFTRNEANIYAGAIGGANAPSLTTRYTETGEYKITATVYHSNKKLATATTTVHV